ncbi:MAG: hypothetical protein OK454_08185, partial [Thaumarchaeota archaeon]|nr:hypothetical protein [Nitrososphaerota archaeon]
MKALNPLLFLLLFFDATCLAPVVMTGLRVVDIWYAPMANTGQVSFLYPFLEFVAVCVAINGVALVALRRLDWGRFIPLDGEIGIRSVVRAVLADRVGRAILAVYVPLCFLSFLVSSGQLLVPNVNISSYFMPLTQIVFKIVGVPLIGALALNLELMAVGVADLFFLSLALVLGYYVVTLVYTSQSGANLGVPASTRLVATQTAGGLLATSVPALATTASMCCLTPTGVNSLLYLVSASSSLLSKKIIFGYGTVAGVFWVTGLLQGVELFSTAVVGKHEQLRLVLAARRPA